MNFYDTVTSKNALEWYEMLPSHLRKTVDSERAKAPSGDSCKITDDPELWKKVTKEIGAPRPAVLPPESNPGDGYTSAQIAEEELRRKWVKRYDELKLAQVILELAPTLQKERMMLNQALGLSTDINGFPLQVEGLDDTQAATVRWIQETGQTPIEVLVEMYRDPEVKVSDRIQAARAMLDFVHRKLPVKQEVETKDITAPRLDPKVIKGLSEKELSQLEALLKKMTNE